MGEQPGIGGLMDLPYSVMFEAPFRMQCIGPSMSGKSTWLFTLLRRVTEFVNPPPQHIWYCYGSGFKQEFLEFPNVEFFEGFDPELVSEKNLLGKKGTILLILDDLINDLLRSPWPARLWSYLSHHYSLSCILVQQQYYPRGFIGGSEVSRNSSYKILFKNCSEKLQISLLGRALYPGQSQFWREVTDDAFARPYSYLVCDLRSNGEDAIRLRSNIFDDTPVCYMPKK